MEEGEDIRNTSKEMVAEVQGEHILYLWISFIFSFYFHFFCQKISFGKFQPVSTLLK